MRRDISPERPLLVAHRAGNSPARLVEAARLGLDIAETDVRACEGRLEVRHSKTMPVLPLLWDRWSLERGWRPRLLLEDLLERADAQTELMLDLKPARPGFALAVREVMRRRSSACPYSVCSQDWKLLEPFAEEDGVRVIHSVGNSRALSVAIRKVRAGEIRHIAVHRKLLSAEAVEQLAEDARVVLSWPVNDLRTAKLLLARGVNGLISDDFHLLAALARSTSPTSPSSSAPAASTGEGATPVSGPR